MGMYNEVYKSCPICGLLCEVQIPQIVLGFGGFNLNTPDTLRCLTYDQLILLKECLKEKRFYCNCGESFLYNSNFIYDEREKLINDLTGSFYET